MLVVDAVLAFDVEVALVRLRELLGGHAEEPVMDIHELRHIDLLGRHAASVTALVPRLRPRDESCIGHLTDVDPDDGFWGVAGRDQHGPVLHSRPHGDGPRGVASGRPRSERGTV